MCKATPSAGGVGSWRQVSTPKTSGSWSLYLHLIDFLCSLFHFFHSPPPTHPHPSIINPHHPPVLQHVCQLSRRFIYVPKSISSGNCCLRIYLTLSLCMTLLTAMYYCSLPLFTTHLRASAVVPSPQSVSCTSLKGQQLLDILRARACVCVCVRECVRAFVCACV